MHVHPFLQGPLLTFVDIGPTMHTCKSSDAVAVVTIDAISTRPPILAVDVPRRALVDVVLAVHS